MDLATILGILVSFGLVFYSILSGEGASTFLNVPSILIVFGGTVGTTLVCFPMKSFVTVISVLKKAFLTDEPDQVEIIKTLEDLAKRARKEGLLALEGAKDDIDDDFYRTGLQLVVDGQEADTVEAILNNEIASIEDRHETGAALMKTMGTYAPAFGMIGTVIGLIQMLQSMEDPSSIGPAMAVALITTFYGALLSNVVFLPLQEKLERRSSAEVNAKTLLLEGLLSIHSGDNPRILVQKLTAFVPPKHRLPEAA